MVKHHICFALLLFFITFSAQAKVTATIDKNPVRVAEAVILTITLDQSAERDELDTSPLLKDFMVGNTSTSSQTSIINGSMSKTTSWRVVLIPKHSGNVIIPPLTVDGQKTNEIALAVLKADDASAAKLQRDIYMQASVSEQQVYVQQQLALTVKLFIGKQLQRGSLSEPTMEQADIQQFGQDKESSDIINGKPYRIIERQYLITPKKSGELSLTPPMFNGEVLSSNNSRGSFFSFSQTEPVALSTEAINIKVFPIPAKVTSTWLPSELLTLHEEWQPNDQFKVGEPITRTITLTAAGLSEEQLPTLSMQSPDALDVYPDQAQNHTRVTNGKLIAQKVQKFALIANQAGSFTLPEITIAWWNTITNKPERAKLPARTIEILPSAKQSANPATTNQSNTAATTVNDSKGPTTEVTHPAFGVAEYYRYTTWLFASLWLLTLVFLIKVIRTNKTLQSQNQQQAVHNVEYQAQLINACKQNNGAQVLKLLPLWLNELPTTTTQVHTLQQAKQLLNNDAFNAQLNLIEQSLFAATTSTWQGDTLLTLIKQYAQTPEAFEQSRFQLNPTH